MLSSFSAFSQLHRTAVQHVPVNTTRDARNHSILPVEGLEVRKRGDTKVSLQRMGAREWPLRPLRPLPQKRQPRQRRTNIAWLVVCLLNSLSSMAKIIQYKRQAYMQIIASLWKWLCNNRCGRFWRCLQELAQFVIDKVCLSNGKLVLQTCCRGTQCRHRLHTAWESQWKRQA